MNVLIDRHHADLFNSLQRLFEDRLGFTVYTPIGQDWWNAGYWAFGQGYGDDRLAQQFLNEAGWVEGIWYDGHHPERPIQGVTLEQARQMDWAYTVATVQDNQRGFRQFADEVGARYVLQVGNTNQAVDWGLDPLALVASEVPISGKGVLYHPEFDAETTFRYREPDGSKVIRSFVNCFPSTYCAPLFVDARGLLPEFSLAIHGIDGPEGNIERVSDIAELMAGSAFGWQDKVQGDGYGFVIHQWAAIGRPLIGHSGHYRGLMAEGFWQDGITCIDLDKRTIGEAASLIGEIVADRARHEEMCQAIRAEFDRIDFATEAEMIRGFLA